jgi:peptidoglycan/xylan/chitin deacetylase (PgdA/CDA1 family)
MPAHGLMFHHFHDPLDYPPSQGSIDADQLAEIIRTVGRGRILPAIEFLDRAVAGKLSEHHVCLTFDDNLLCQYDVAVPVLEDFGLTAFWFVCTSVMQGNIERLEIYRHFRTTQFQTVDDFYAAFFIRIYETEFGRRTEGALKTFIPEKYLEAFPFYTEADRRFRFVRDEVLGADSYAVVMDAMMRDAHYDVREVAKSLWMANEDVLSLHGSGHVIGLHSHTHPTRIERLSDDDQRYEYKSNHSHLASLLGEPPLAMSHPSNSYNRGTLDILHSLGMKLGFRTNMQLASGFGPLEVPREDHANLVRRATKAA